MNVKHAFSIAAQALFSHRLRTTLTLIGIAISVASVIAIITILHGASVYIDERVNTLGSRVITISQQPSLVTSYVDYLRFKRRKVITRDMYQAFRTLCRSCDVVGAAQAAIVGVRFGSRSSENVTLRGWTLEMPALAVLDIGEGRYFTAHEEEYGSHVVILGTDVADALMREGDPIGNPLRIDGVLYTIIGVAEARGKALGTSQDNYVVVPMSTFQRTYGSAASLTVYTKAPPTKLGVEEAFEEATLLMRMIRHDSPGDENSFSLEKNNTVIALLRKITQLFAAVAVPVAATSLVVGGVVTMNIMLVSVNERTAEIGLRKAVGASRRDIQLQFLIESGAMAGMGGAIGVLLGVASGSAVGRYSGFPATVAWWSVLAGLLMSTVIGLFFGIYPARRAALLDPIEALGRE